MSDAEMVPVTDEDRKAAAPVMISREAEYRVLNRLADENGIVQAFARHRLAAEAAAIERIEVAVTEYAARCDGFGTDDEAAGAILGIIRSLKEGASHVG